FARQTGRQYRLFDYFGDPEAESVLVIMGSGAETAVETVNWLNENTGMRYGVMVVRLYRPFHAHAFLHTLPVTVERVAVLDRTKEPGSLGEPLYLDVSLALRKATRCKCGSRAVDPVSVGGRYGIGSKEFTPGMVKAVFDNLARERPLDHFTVGIRDDLTDLSLEVDPDFTIGKSGTRSALFFGLGSDGTVGANKNTIKIIGEATDLYTQAYFVYDSKKSGGLTTSHLRFGAQPVKAPYLINAAEFVGCHQPQFLGRVDVTSALAKGGTLLLNSPHAPAEVWASLPRDVQEAVIEKEARLYAIDAYLVAGEAGMGRRINTIMQVCFFALSDVLETDDAIGRIKTAIEKTYGRKGPQVVAKNCAAVDLALTHLHAIEVPAEASSAEEAVQCVPDDAPDFVQRVTAQLLAGRGDLLPVSAFPVDGVWPSGTSQYEKRRIAANVPVWHADTCTQCNKCAFFCPHAAIRPKVYDTSELADAPQSFRSTGFRGPDAEGKRFTIQVFPEDCTGCNACVALCPAQDSEGRRAIEMEPLSPILETEKRNLEFFQTLTEVTFDPTKISAKHLPLRRPLFEFSGACSGCTQTPYVRTLTQLFGDKLLIANATGCSSIYGGNLPTTPYCCDADGRGPAWANSLFEDNAEFGLGLHLAAKRRTETARRLLAELAHEVGTDIATAALAESDESRLRELIASIRQRLDNHPDPRATRLLRHLDYLVEKVTWIVGGDGWAYDIGYGGLDHVLASGRNVNVLVLDTEVYSNTGGQASKATPIGAQAKFAAAGKHLPKKDLGQIAMSYGGIYVGQIALGANPQQGVDVLREAESFDGPSLVLAYGPCLAHGIDLTHGPARQKAAVDTGYWPLYRFDPRRTGSVMPALRLDSFEPSTPVATFMQQENRFRSLERSNPERAAALLEAAQAQVDSRWRTLERLAAHAAEEDDDDGWG
ncbi:MAG: pyruvate:ferredoxin (flavodoxin) oxidoreductase, partial [Opitutales bacterium]